MKRLLKTAALFMTVAAIAGCQPVADTDAGVQGVGTEETVAEESSVLTLDNITDEQLAELTGFDADFKAYFEKGPTRVTFLKRENEALKPLGDIAIYTNAQADSTALYIYETDGAVEDARLDEFTGSVSTEGVEYDCMFYSFGSMMEKQPSESALSYTKEDRQAFEETLVTEFEDKALYELQDYLGVYVPLYRYEIKDSTLKLDTYMIVSPVGYTASTDVNVIYDETGAILSIYMGDSYGPEKIDPFERLYEAAE